MTRRRVTWMVIAAYLIALAYLLGRDGVVLF